ISAMPPTTARRRSMICAGPVIQPAAPILNPASAAEEVSVMRTIRWMLPDNRSPIPSGDKQNITGTTKAGSVYFHACIVVATGEPPQMAEAAKGANAVGGETSASTA